jgi:hypothetical protein
VSAVGSIGIVFGILGTIASLAIFAVAGGLMSVSASAARQAKQFAQPTMPVSKPDQPTMIFVAPTPPEVGPDGLAEGDRQSLVPLMQHVLPLSIQQQQQVDALLREAGAQVFPRMVPKDDTMLAGALLDHGTMASASASASETVFFVTKGGRAEIHDDGAVFRPAHGASTVRITAGPRLNSTGHPILRRQDVDAVIRLIRQASGGKLNGPQTETLSRLLADPDQQMIALNGPADGQTIGISGAGPQPGGYLLVGFAGGSLLLTPAGAPLLKDDALPGVSLFACIGTMVMALVGLAMAIWLVALSRRVMKRTIFTPRPYRRWAAAKIVASVLSAIMFGWMIATFVTSRPESSGAGYAGTSAGIALSAAGCVFPVLATVLFRTRSARLYFDGVM